MDSSDLRYIFNHVFLPPKLPQSDDSSHLRNQYLTRLYREALDDAATFDTSCKWYKHSTMLKILLSESEDGMISTVDLECALPAMRAEGELLCSLPNVGHHIPKYETLMQVNCRHLPFYPFPPYFPLNIAWQAPQNCAFRNKNIVVYFLFISWLSWPNCHKLHTQTPNIQTRQISALLNILYLPSPNVMFHTVKHSSFKPIKCQYTLSDSFHI